MLELLASGYLSASAHTQPSSRSQEQYASCAELYNRLTADAAPQSDQAAACKVTPPPSDASNSTLTGLRQPGRTTSSSSYNSSQADGESPGAWQQEHSSGAGDADSVPAQQPPSTGRVPTHSAYFPAGHNRQPQPQQHKVPAQPWHRADRPGHISSGLCSTQAPSSATCSSAQAAPSVLGQPSSPAAGTWQESLQQGLFCKLAQQATTMPPAACGKGTPPVQQPAKTAVPVLYRPGGDACTPLQARYVREQQSSTYQSAAAQPKLPDIYISTGFEVEEGLLSTSSTSHSAHSELLDSDDLDELAGLCDTLLQQHTTIPEQAGVAAATPASHHTDTSGPAAQQQPQHCLCQQELAGTAWPSGAVSGQPHWQHPQRSGPMPLSEVDDTACVPGLQALAAQLRQLQEQVAATVMDAVPARGSSSSNGSSGVGGVGPPGRHPVVGASHAGVGTGTRGSVSPADGRPGCAGATTQYSSSMQDTQAGVHPAPQHSNSSKQMTTGAGSSGGGGGLPVHTQGMACESEGMTTLQQQLAQRMQEVKERLSNICNGMLQDAGPAAAGAAGAGHAASNSAPCQHSGSFFSPPASPPAPERPTAADTWREQLSTAGQVGASPAGKLGGTATARGMPVEAAGIRYAGSFKAQQDGIKARASSTPSPMPAGGSSMARSPAAAFAAIKASIDSTSDGPASTKAAIARPAAAAGNSRPRVGPHKPSAQAGGFSYSSAPVNSGTPAAAFQGSWASAEDCPATDDSEGSWATVDDTEQEQLQLQPDLKAGQQVQNDQHLQRAPARGAATNVGSESSAGYSDRQGDSSSRHGSSHGGANNPSPTHNAGSPVGGRGRHDGQQQRSHQEQQGGVHIVHGAAQQSPSKVRHDLEQPASPVSCESSMLGPARLAAEVVYSPLKVPHSGAPGSKGTHAAAGAAAEVISPLRQRNV